MFDDKVLSASSIAAAIQAGLVVPTAAEWLEARPDLHFSSELTALLCDRYVKSERAMTQAEGWILALAAHEKDPENTPMPEMPTLVRGDVEQAFPIVEILRETFAFMAEHEGDRVLFYARVPDRQPTMGGGKCELRARDMIELLDRGDPLVREYLETLTQAASRMTVLQCEVKNPASKELKFRKVGTDVGGRYVLEVDGSTDIYGAAKAISDYCKKWQVARALLWNGIATLCFPGMTPDEWLLENEIRRTSYQSGRWPAQIMAFSPEVDPFKITRDPEPAPS